MSEEQLVICRKNEEVSWEEITELLHAAYREHAERGLEYVACCQSVEETVARVAGGICFVALLDGKLVGTATLHIKRKKAELTQIGIHPYLKKKGIGNRLLDTVINTAEKAGCDMIRCNTAEKALDIVYWYLRNGWRKIGLTSHRTTNYYSIVFCYPLRRKCSNWKCFLRFRLLSCVCRGVYRENGQVRLIFRSAYVCLRTIYRRLYAK